MEIVQNIQQANQAVARTADYQSPGVGGLLSGINTAITKGIDAYVDSSKGSGKANKDLSLAYDYFAERTAQADSKSFSGPSQIKDFADETYSTAMSMFGIDETDVSNLAKLSGFERYGKIPQNMRDKDAKIKESFYQSAVTIGGRLLGPDASMDNKYALGANFISSREGSFVEMDTLGKLTPEQQTISVNSGGANSIIKTIQDGWSARQESEDNQMPIETAFMLYRNGTISNLKQTGMDQVIAEQITDTALIYDRLSIYGESALESIGAQYYREAAKKAQETDQAIIQNDMKQQFLLGKYDVKIPAAGEKGGQKTVSVSGAQALVLLSQEGSEGSAGAAAQIAQAVNALDILPQIASNTKNRFSYRNLRLSMSGDGANMKEVLKDNPVASKNLSDATYQALLTSAAETREAPNPTRPFDAVKAWNSGHKVSNGSFLTPEAIDAGLGEGITKEKQDMVKALFDNIALGSNLATRGSDGAGYGFYQISGDGQLRYIELEGSRAENVWSVWPVTGGYGRTGVYRLVDKTHAGEWIEMGDREAVNMRENIPFIKEALDILESSYGADKKEMYDKFNLYMIQHTDAGNKFRRQQILESYGQASPIKNNTDQLEQIFNMTSKYVMDEVDARAVKDAIPAQGYNTAAFGRDYVAPALKAPLEAGLEASEKVGKGIAKVVAGDITLEDVKKVTSENVSMLTDLVSGGTVTPTEEGYVSISLSKGEELESPTSGTVVYSNKNLVVIRDKTTGIFTTIQGDDFNKYVERGEKINLGESIGEATKDTTTRVYFSGGISKKSLKGATLEPLDVSEVISIAPGEETSEQFLAPVE